MRALKEMLTPPADAIREKDIAQCYKQYKSRFVEPARVRLLQILVPVPPNADHATIAAAEERMKTFKSRLDTGTSFDVLAREAASIDTGWKTRGQLGGKLGSLAFSLEVGEVGGPVRTSAGFVLSKLVDKRPQYVYTLEEAKENIVAYLRRKARDEQVEKLVAKLRKSANIEYVVQP